ncbi:efflux RND transporter periplasmic adaptor subunit [Fundidesulfovibrio butyratiphilus]
MMRRRKSALRVAGPLFMMIAALALAGCGSDAPKRPNPREISAATTTAHVQRAITCRSFPAQVESQRSITLSSKLSGTVVRVYANEGDTLRPGDPILSLDDKDLQGRREALAASLNQASLERQALGARVAHAKTTVDRIGRLLAQKAVSQDDFDKAQADYLSQKREEEAIAARMKNVAAQQDELKALEAYTRVSALSGGVLTRRYVDQGAFVTAGQPLALVDDPSGGFDLAAQVDESLLPGLRVGQPLVARVPALGAGPFVTHVTALVGRIDPATRTFKLKAAVPAAAPDKPSPQAGMFGRVFLPAGEDDKVLIPRECLRLRGDLPCVFVVDSSGLIHFRVVKVGSGFIKADIEGKTYLTDSDAFDDPGTPRYVEVLSGVSDGERLVCSDTETLRDGDRLREVKP